MFFPQKINQVYLTILSNILNDGFLKKIYKIYAETLLLFFLNWYLHSFDKRHYFSPWEFPKASS